MPASAVILFASLFDLDKRFFFCIKRSAVISLLLYKFGLKGDEFI